jgi:Transposase.
VICRDRSSGYAEGARIGAPQAEQVADRYHLWANLGQAVEKTVNGHRSRLAEPPSQPADTPDEPQVVRLPTELKIVTRLREQHAAAHELWQQGMSKAGIGRKLGLHQATVRKLVNAPSADDVVPKACSGRTSSTRMSATCTGAGTMASETPPSSTARFRNRATPEASWPSNVICGSTAPGADTHPIRGRSLRRSARSPHGS